MREIRPSGSEGGETEPNRSSLPLYRCHRSAGPSGPERIGWEPWSPGLEDSAGATIRRPYRASTGDLGGFARRYRTRAGAET
jgi:hypothetical protein